MAVRDILSSADPQFYYRLLMSLLDFSKKPMSHDRI